jgi:hypothetical protein
VHGVVMGWGWGVGGHAPRCWCRSCRLDDGLGQLPAGPAWKLPSLAAKLPAGVQYGVLPTLVAADGWPDWPDDGRNSRFLACGQRRRGWARRVRTRANGSCVRAEAARHALLPELRNGLDLQRLDLRCIGLLPWIHEVAGWVA